jgi:predicted short-subunit dehydrogenase-like oxidoreductase (DUF2520 family)
MKVVIIGSGNVATHLAKALLKADVEIAQIWSNTYKNAVELADLVGAKAIKQLHEVEATADLCMIAVKDDAIATIAAQLKDFKGVVAHTAGAVNLSVFSGLVANYGVFYPLQTFSKTKEISFLTIPICIEANNEHTLSILKLVGDKLSKKVKYIDSEKRKILHLAAVFACNFTNHLYAISQEILEANQLEFDLLRPLISETANKVQFELPTQVQTGPAFRKDEKTLHNHEELLNSQPELKKMYKMMSDGIKKTR